MRHNGTTLMLQDGDPDVVDPLIGTRWPARREHAVGLLAIVLGGLYLT